MCGGKRLISISEEKLLVWGCTTAPILSVFGLCISVAYCAQREREWTTVSEVEFGCVQAVGLVGYSGDQICELVERGGFARTDGFIRERGASEFRMLGFI